MVAPPRALAAALALVFALIALPGAPAAAQVCDGSGRGAGTFKEGLVSGGLERTYLLTIPEGLDLTAPAPVVFNFHGFGSAGWQQWWLADMSRHAGERGMISVHPRGFEHSWNGGSCCGQAVQQDIDDVQFVRDMIAAISAEYCIDPDRVYAMGMSNGGYFSHRLGCELSDQIAAIGPVAGRLTVACNPVRPVPVFAVHGTADGAVSFEGGQAGADAWAEMNACQRTVERREGPQTTCTQHLDCDEGAEVAFCAVDGGPHWWFNSPAFNTTASILDFFLAHPRR